jgi:hypothetical protein
VGIQAFSRMHRRGRIGRWARLDAGDRGAVLGDPRPGQRGRLGACRGLEEPLEGRLWGGSAGSAPGRQTRARAPDVRQPADGAPRPPLLRAPRREAAGRGRAHPGQVPRPDPRAPPGRGGLAGPGRHRARAGMASGRRAGAGARRTPTILPAWRARIGDRGEGGEVRHPRHRQEEVRRPFPLPLPSDFESVHASAAAPWPPAARRRGPGPPALRPQPRRRRLRGHRAAGSSSPPTSRWASLCTSSASASSSARKRRSLCSSRTCCRPRVRVGHARGAAAGAAGAAAARPWAGGGGEGGGGGGGARGRAACPRRPGAPVGPRWDPNMP